MLGHAAALYDDLTVAENVRFAVRAAGGDVGRVDGALERLGLVGRLCADVRSAGCPPVRESGSPSRCSSRAARDSGCLDEPHAALDAAGAAEFDEIVSRPSRGRDGARRLARDGRVDGDRTTGRLSGGGRS